MIESLAEGNMKQKHRITLSKVADGEYKVFKNRQLVGTAIFERKFYPAPNLPVGFEMTIEIKNGPTLCEVVRSISHGRRAARRMVK